ncbi:MAG: hypothetical protein N4A49_16495 [Marinifilaceae bacterium]|jgi:PKD repeat protein|nr:hypothetical protein [Marinifilaceae bacterium]
MRKLFFYLLLINIITISCKDDDDDKDSINIDFSIEIEGEAPEAKLNITNHTSGATKYLWTFGVNADPTSSTDESPQNITITHPGDIEIKLVAENDSQKKELSKTVTITGTVPTPLSADFEVKITGEAPNAQLEITNNSTSATKFTWTFGEGASINSSEKETPETISVDKAGDLEIKLVSENESEKKEVTKTVSISGNSAILEYNDIKFVQDSTNSIFKLYFSTSEGKLYEESEVTSSISPKIDLISYADNYFNDIKFNDPSDLPYDFPTIEGLTKTIVDNKNTNFTSSDFDNITDDAQLKSETVTENYTKIDQADLPVVITFENSAGKKGVIRIKDWTDPNLTVDIKIQKYSN